MTVFRAGRRGALRSWERVIGSFVVDRNVGLAAAAMFLLALGENLWRRFIPRYLDALGAPASAIGLYGSTQDLLDGLYQYPGGWVADRFGRRAALLACVATATLGYAVYLVAPTWPVAFLGLVLVAAWSSMASPTLFAVVGDALPKGRRTIGFTVQAILQRIPVAIAPTLGGLAIAAYGLQDGIRLGLAVTVALGVGTLGLVAMVRVSQPAAAGSINALAVWRSLSRPLRRLLVSDILIRACEGMAGVFVVLYATRIVGVTTPQFGLLVAVEMATAMAIYLPAAAFADRLGRKPFVVATFMAFALFPIAVSVARSFAGLVGAFVVAGLREVGEPARKALIVDLGDSRIRGRTVGLYYLVRCLAISPAAFLGGFLWSRSPAAPFLAAGVLGLAGTLTFALSREGTDAT